MIVPTSGTTVGPGGSFEEVVSNQPTGLMGVIGVRIVDNAGTTVDPRRTAGITEQPAASGIYTVVLNAPGGAGQYSIIWDTDPAGVLSPSNSTVHPLTVVTEEIAPPAESVLCGLWFDPATLSCPGVVAPVDSSAYVLAACELLYLLSGSQYPGICTSTVRPCVPWWCGCGEEGCSACFTPWNTARLFEPLVTVDQVVIDGVALDPAAYRIYDGRFLQRIDGRGWPYQNLDLAPGERGSWEVTFTHGASPPTLGVQAARALACHLVSSGANAADCALPAHVQSLNRQGVNQTFNPDVTAGLALEPVSFFLGGYGRGMTDVWSPDLPPHPSEVL